MLNALIVWYDERERAREIDIHRLSINKCRWRQPPWTLGMTYWLHVVLMNHGRMSMVFSYDRADGKDWFSEWKATLLVSNDVTVSHGRAREKSTTTSRDDVEHLLIIHRGSIRRSTLIVSTSIGWLALVQKINRRIEYEEHFWFSISQTCTWTVLSRPHRMDDRTNDDLDYDWTWCVNHSAQVSWATMSIYLDGNFIVDCQHTPWS